MPRQSQPLKNAHETSLGPDIRAFGGHSLAGLHGAAPSRLSGR